MRCECKGGDVPHTGEAVHKRVHGRCTRTATTAMRRTDRGKHVESPWYEYCDPCATAIETYQGSAVERRAQPVAVKLTPAQQRLLDAITARGYMVSIQWHCSRTTSVPGYPGRVTDAMIKKLRSAKQIVYVSVPPRGTYPDGHTNTLSVSVGIFVPAVKP